MSRTHTWGWSDVRLVGLGLLAGVLLVLAMSASRAPVRSPVTGSPQPAGWSEIAWPHAVDPWWPSRAFTCAKSTCGASLTLLVRAKLGFCNCATGVADDEELERIGDFALLAGKHAPLVEGKPITVAWMKGRSRPYTFTSKEAGGANLKALLIGYNDRCDAIVATAVLADGEPAMVESAVLTFLNSPGTMRWAEVTLGL